MPKVDLYSDAELLRLLKYYTKEKLKNDRYLLTQKEIDENPNLPASTTYYNRFQGFKDAYLLIGYDYDKYNREAFKNELKDKYFELSDQVGSPLTMNDIKEFCRQGLCNNPTTYWKVFGGISELSKEYCNQREFDSIEQTNRSKSQPVQVVIYGKLYTSLMEVSKVFDIKQSTIYTRYYKGLRGEDLIKPVRNKKTSTNK